MKNIRFVLAILLLGSLAVSLTTCGGGESLSNLTSISVPVTIPVGANQQFTAFGVYSDGTNHDITTQVTWASSSPSVATVTSSGRATAGSAGSVTITATSGTFSGSTPLTVTSVTLSSISVTPANPSVPAGFGQQFVAIGRSSDGTSHDITTQVTWASSNTAVVTVTSSGRATVGAAAAGSTVTITATLGSISGSTTLTVTSATLSSISVTPANPSVPVAAPQQFSAIGTFSDGTSHDITNQVTWSSSNTSVATINNSSGLATAGAAAAGSTVTITATLGSISGSTTLTVTSATLSSIINMPALFVGTIQQFIALGAFDDGSTQNISDGVFWTSSSPSVATINTNSGVVTTLSAGFTNIVATTQSNSFPEYIQGGTNLFVLVLP
ncbi:MAG: Ig-like domain-containing protein [Thermodesulfobacteriota bacterium]